MKVQRSDDRLKHWYACRSHLWAYYEVYLCDVACQVLPSSGQALLYARLGLA
jgi:hypothetical protein